MYGGGPPPPLSKRMFDKYDKDRSGSIDQAEFKALAYESGHQLNATELSLAMKKLDKDGSGKITYDEFKGWWADNDRFKSLKLDDAQHEVLTQACAYFKYFDKSGDGVIDKNEAKLLHADLVKNGLIKLSFDDMMADLDTDKSGTIAFSEYVDWLIRKNTLKVKVMH